MFLLAAFLPLSLVAQVSLSQTLEGDTGIYLQCLPTGEKILNWSGRADRTYFLQASPDLLDWSWSPNIEPGRNGPMNQAVEGPVKAGFFRLIYTDQVPAEGETVETADYDGDGLSNRLELTPRPRPGGVQGVIGLKPDIQTNPLRADTDGDGLSDQWELENGLDPTDDGSRNPNNGSNGDPDGDGVSNLVEQNQRTNPENAEDFPIQMISTWKMATGTGDTTPAEQTDFYLTSYAGWDAQTGSTQVVSQVTYASIQAARDGMIFPTTPGSNLQNYQISNGLTNAGVTSYFTLSPQSDNVNGYFSSTRIWIKAPSKSTEQKFYFLKIEEQGIGASEAESSQTEGITITIPANQQFSAPYDLEVNPLQQAGVQRWSSVVLLPVQVVEVSPKTKDEGDVEIAGSDKPSMGLPLTPFVELNPVADRIAHRELKVKIGEALKGKTVTWTLEAVPGATPATIRGEWSNSATHPNRFEASTAYGANGFTQISQASGRTIVANDGFTAIRVNVPPIGFNQVRIKIQIEGMDTLIDLIDMEVPSVVVIDPGHGGTSDVFGSSANNAVSPSGILEKTMTLDYGLALRDSLRAKRHQDKLNLRVFMTREIDENLTGEKRANKARDNGADVLFVLHFNSDDDSGTKAHPRVPHQSRGTLEVYRTDNNVSPQEDTDLSSSLIDRIVSAMTPFDAGANHRGRVAYGGNGVGGPAVSSDVYNGNTATYHPIRTAYIEGEFIDFGANTTADRTDDTVDILLNTGSNAATIKIVITNAIREGIIQNLRDQQ